MTSGDFARVSVVLATYERPEALNLVLHALSEQETPPFEVIVADDGSEEAVANVVRTWRRRLPVSHVWQPDEGFRKARILNQAALSARGDYLAFLDADCLPRREFLAALRRAARPGWFISTKRLLLGERFTTRVVEETLPVWRWSAAEWLLRAPGEVRRPGFLIPGRDRRRPWRDGQPEFVPPFSAYCLFGLPREDFERVNGYDARCVRSNDGEDQDLAIRLRRSGLRCGWPGPKATVIHLWHPVRPDKSTAPPPLFRETEKGNHVEAVIGLRELAREREPQVTAKRVGESSASSEPVKE